MTRLAMTVVACLIALAFFSLSGASFAQTSQGTPTPAYTGTASCSGCHEGEAASWRKSHHAHAWMEPGPDTVDGDFGNVRFEHNGTTSRFFTKDGSYFIETSDVAGEPKTFKVVGVDGITPLQQYLVETEPGRIQSFDVVWDQIKRRWYHLYGDQAPEANDGLHWTGPYKNWNGRCAECHATGFEKNYSPATRTYSSRQAEIGVGCEACHGPGEAHVAWARDPAAVSPFPGTGSKGLLIDFAKGLPQTELQQCASCHSRREAFEDGNPLPGTPFHDAYRLSPLQAGLYHADGQILDEVYVYGSFLQSKMYANGVTCTNCHDPHSGQLKAEGNAVCTQCHSPAANPAFPALQARLYDDPSHHFHEQGTAGAECKSCHMIERVYMGIDGRRDHSFRVPRPDLSDKLGTPDACTDCHADKGAAWAAGELEKWFPDSTHRGPHFGEVFAEARENASGMSGDLLGIAKQASFPGIVRASALDLLMSAATPEITSEAASLIEDPDPLVRAAALTLQQQATPMDRISRAIPALDDPVKAVRIAAARLFIGAPIAQMPPKMSASARKAMGEWQQSLAFKADFPEVHLVLGGTALVLRDARAAVAAFEEAARLDPQLVDAWIMQVRIKMAVGDMAGAQMSLQKALLANPGVAALEAYRNELSR
ncbi:cytochrome c3 family protein [Roseibium suaedae]|uniref:Doubled CXXCH domain-containing protein n=1 Tax=Roseibium suaedae TaxID=735517 RepID=A0A1M7NQF2_9HYPH|nr:multiheme c-type cytochrome [Roseibium suaedae]SHN06177.1 doubled CXXCH domain-containing protein [Roseibium suaedae]